MMINKLNKEKQVSNVLSNSLDKLILYDRSGDNVDDDEYDNAVDDDDDDDDDDV